MATAQSVKPSLGPCIPHRTQAQEFSPGSNIPRQVREKPQARGKVSL